MSSEVVGKTSMLDVKQEKLRQINRVREQYFI